jgi:NhaA family Na+:H+ antiporter
LTVALFVSQQAFSAELHPEIQGAAKMGALLSAGVAGLSIFLGWMLRIKKVN